MKTIILLTLSALALAAQTPEKLPVPTPPADVVIIADADGIKTKYALSDAAVHSMNAFLHEQGFTGTFSERFLAWMIKTTEVLMSREQYAPPAVKTIDTAIDIKKAERRAVIDAAKAEKKK